ncbi:hypothetical protein [Paraburkholderia bannensis]|uniref:hypothetical protein n=1 Tax=Paraburkholderia bannensis TaxID=765414 RepID=UPI000484278D
MPAEAADNAALAGRAQAADGANPSAQRASDTTDLPPVLPAPVSAGSAPSSSSGSRDLALSVQDAVRYADLRDGGGAWRNQASLDLRYEKTLAGQFDVNASWRLDRFDPLSSAAAPAHTESLLREAYVGWRPGKLTTLDVGRMNQRVGVAFGYNPTDFFKAGAVDLDVSPDPLSRRTNRLGTIGVRGQQVWDSGSAQMLFSPRLASRMEPGDPEASGTLERTNSIGRWMFVGSQRMGASLQPQVVAYGEEGQAPQFGMNLSGLFGNAVVGYTEISMGRRPSLIASTMGTNGDSAFRVSSASGLTWTLPTTNLALTLELQTNGAGASPAQWRTLAATNPMAWGRAVQGSVTAQELPTRYGVFAMAIWRNAVVRRVDVSAFGQFDQGGGGQGWLEVRRHFDRFDVALQLQTQYGPVWDRYGAMSERSSVQVLAAFYR